MRVLLDTNVIVSGLLNAASPPGQLLAAWQDGEFVLVGSNAQLDELRRVLGYDRLRSRIGAQQAADVLDNFGAAAELVEAGEPVDLSPDPDDNVILAIAIAGRADLIVSGDKGDMLALREAAGIPIVDPAEAARRLGDRGGC